MSSGEDVKSELTSADYIVIAIVASMQLVSFFVSVHLWWWRHWPPYVVKNINLVIIMVRLSPILLLLPRKTFAILHEMKDMYSL